MKKYITMALTFICAPFLVQAQTNAKEYEYNCIDAKKLLGSSYECSGIVRTKDLQIPIECNATRTTDCDLEGYEIAGYKVSYEIIKNVATIIELDTDLNVRYKKIIQYLSEGTIFYPIGLSPYFSFDIKQNMWKQRSAIGDLFFPQLIDIKKQLAVNKTNLSNVKKVLVSGQRAWVISKDTCFTLSGRSLEQTPRELAGNKTGLYDSANTPFHQCFIDEYTQRIKILKELERRLNPEIVW